MTPASDGNEHGDMQFGAVITPQFVFGGTGQGQQAMAYLDPDQLLFPTGVHLSAYSMRTEEMRLIPLASHVRSVTSVVISSNKKYCAVVEGLKGSAGEGVSVYSCATGKCVRTLQLDPEVTGPDPCITSISFSGSSKLLVVQCSAPENTMLVYRWYLGKLLLCTRHDMPVIDAAFSPLDDMLLAVLSADAAQVFRLEPESSSARVQTITVQDDSRGAFSSMCWLMGNQLAMATDKGRIQVNQDAEIKAMLAPDIEDQLLCVVARGRGLLAAGRKGVLYCYEPQEASARRNGAKELFHLVRSLDTHLVGRALVCIAVSPGDDCVCVMTSAGEMLVTSMTLIHEKEEKGIGATLGTGWQLTADAEHDPFHLVAGGLGGQQVVGLSAISQQPLLAVVTANKMLRVINYKTRRPVVIRQLLDDVLCVDLHPSGSMLLVGTHDRLTLYCIALDELQEVAEFGVKKCHLARFSPGGSRFAAVGRSNSIVVHHAYNLSQLAVLKGHVSAVTDLSFSPNERFLCSTGAGGAVYFWDLATGLRMPEAEYVDKRCIYTAAAFTGSAHRYGVAAAVVRTHDGKLQHVQNGKVEFELAGLPSGTSACVQILGGDRVVLASDEDGGVASYQWPANFPAPPGMDRFLTPHLTRLHAGQCPISHMVCLPETNLLFTASPDGCVVMSGLQLVLAGALVEDNRPVGGASGFVSTVLVPVDRLTSNMQQLVDMAGSLSTIKSDAEYAAFRTAQALREALARLEGQLAGAHKAMELKEQELAVMREAAEAKEHDIVKTLENAHMAAAEELESLFDKRLELEAAKLRQTKALADDGRFSMEERMKRMQAQHQAEMQSVNERHARQLQKVEASLAEARHEQLDQNEFWDEYAQQAEVDYDQAEERLNVRLSSAAEAAESREGLLRAELNLLKRATLRLKGEKALDAKRLEKLLKDNTKLQDTIDDHQETIAKLQRELKEREAVLADNYNTLQVLRRKVQDLEKHKYVLAYKAEAYHSELEPRKAEVRALQEELDMHQVEMTERLAAQNTAARQLAEKDIYAKSLKSELTAAKLRISHQESLLKMFSSDLAQVYNASDERGSAGAGQKSARQKALEALYSKYVISAAAGGVRSNAQVEAELTRHLQMSELRTALVQHRLEEEQVQARTDRRVLVHQNVQLLRELQVAVQDNKALGRGLTATQSSLRELSIRHRILEGKLQAGLASNAGPDSQASVQRSPWGNGDETLGVLEGVQEEEDREVDSRAEAERGDQSVRAKSRPWTAAPHSRVNCSVSGRPQSAGVKHHTFRTAGGPAGNGLLLRGSPARALHELVAVEREHISQLLAELAVNSEQVEKQQAALSNLHSALQAALLDQQDTARTDANQVAGAEGALSSQTAQSTESTSVQAITRPSTSHGPPRHSFITNMASPRASRARPASAAVSGRFSSAPPTQGHQAVVRPSQAHTQNRKVADTLGYGMLITSNSPVVHTSHVKRRPTSAAGVGMRAYVNHGLKSWRDL